MPITDEDRRAAVQQIANERRLVDFDVAEMTAELLTLKLDREEIVIPQYQRSFVWDDERRSGFIESMILGLPIPYLFMADVGGNLEVVDGSQRLRTVAQFLKGDFNLAGMQILASLEGFKFDDLPIEEQRRLKNRTMRTIVLSSKADLTVRFEVFQRINSTSMVLTAAEFRHGAFPGPFYTLVEECAKNPTFTEICPVTPDRAKRREREELVLRFFAYTDSYRDFSHDVTRFLNEYLRRMNAAGANEIASRRVVFEEMVTFAKRYFPNGMRKAEKGTTVPRVRFEALSVGVALALRARPGLQPGSVDWLNSEEFTRLTTTHASNSGPRLTARVEYVRNQLLA